MSVSAAFDQKEQVRRAIDIVDLVGSYLSVQRRGHHYLALCPWHDDTRPSLQINQERQSWKCWVCDDGGDIFSFVMKREGIGFREALEMLAERAGVALPRSGPAAKPGSPDDKTTLYQAMAWAEKQFHDCLCHASEAEPARRYLAERGISGESIARFRLGFSPDRWQWLLDRAKATPFSPQVLAAAGLVGKSEQSGNYYDRFKGRLLFSIRDVQGRPIATGGRILPEAASERTAKYINSPETRLYSKSDQLYALDVARDHVAKTREVVVVEGYTDVIMAHQHGVNHVVAVCGTALGSRHIQILRRHADRILLVLDGDEAGQRRTNEILELFVAEQIDLRILTLPSGLDPCDFIREQGGDSFRGLLSTAIDAIEHRVQQATRDIDPVRDIHAASRALEEILSTLAKSPRLKGGADSAVRLREQRILATLARKFALEEEEIRRRLAQLRQAGEKSRATAVGNVPASPKPRSTSMDARTRELFEILTLKPQLVPRAVAVISPELLAEGPAREIFDLYCKLIAADEYADTARVLTETEDPHLKNLLATIDWESHDKAADALATPESRFDTLLDSYARARDEQQLRDVRQGRVSDEEAVDTLLKFFEQERSKHTQTPADKERHRQGRSVPTDG